ncbi:SPS1 Serine threonine protein kinase [Pyrenophora tritici-repentis]|nr:SPS1 Serine threonine protein kinase [Pyrenophora tritici-repentis]KAI1546484.1 SPS1 Serine threonine protein kinase [Pyrenophora tritici-repentis]KAI1588286.1 SPS1 Serine threonine protein kinase [Pyrenophora tritici-repentis]
MLGDEVVMKLKRSMSDGDHLIPMGVVTPSGSPETKTPFSKNKYNRSFSWSKLTDSLKGKRGPSSRSSRSSRSSHTTSIDKRDISGPILDPKSPLCPPRPKTPISNRPAVSSPVTPKRTSGHSYSASDPTNNSSPRVSHQIARCRPPPPPPIYTNFESEGSTLVESPLERIAESPHEPHDIFSSEPLGIDRVYRYLRGMEPARLQPPNMGGTKGRAMQQAKDMELLVAERAKRGGEEPPPYDFYELIGKGAYGRVYKGKSRNTGALVAIKIIEIDKVDYEEMTHKNLQDTLKEIDILQQLRDSKARPYVNIIEEARPVHNELWIISEYASGGSVNTLMKPTAMSKDPGPGLPEKFIIPIARELAQGLKYIHEAGVLHRDLKSNNVLILEDGRVQLCDFGVSNTLEPERSKRSTIVGTPFWMAPELQKEWVKDADPHSLLQPKEISYGSEVDIWAYACTIFEMACGLPPHHKISQFDLPTAGVPVLEGDRFSDELKEFLAFVFQPNPHDRPTPDEILEHPYLVDSAKMYPTVSLVKLVEDYYVWEQQGGARQSLFNPYEHAPQFGDPFAAGEPFNGMSLPPVADLDRFEQLQARFKEESIVRGQKRLNKLFDTNTTPYRYSAVDMPEPPNGRPPSDLVLRDFNPGAPNRETVIDLDFSMPSADEIPNIDLGEVPTIRANRMKSMIRELEEEERRDAFNEEDELTKRATKDWTFPSMNDDSNRKTMEWSFAAEQPQPNRKTMEWSFAAEQPNRKTMEWSFPAQPQKPNRRTVEWTFDAAMAEANNEPRNRASNRISRRRETKEWTFPKDENRKTQDFAFPMGSPQRPSLRQAQTAPLEPIDDYPEFISSPPGSPLRSSMIDLDMAMVEDYRPSTSGSETYTASGERINDNPFNLEDQVQLSQNNHRASFHMKSQSEPNQSVPGLLTPQQYDEQGHLHARGVSSASQVQGHPKPVANNNMAGGQYHRPSQRSQQMIWDGWSHTMAYGLGSDDMSPPMSVTTDTSLEEDDVDELWENFERLTFQQQQQQYHLSRPYPATAVPAPLRSSRSRNDSHATSTSTYTLDSDTDDSSTYNPYLSYSSSDFDTTNSFRKSTLSVGPNGKPLVEFPVPSGPPIEALLMGSADGDVAAALQHALLRSACELRDGVRASRDLLRAMRLADVEGGGIGEEDEGEEGEEGEEGSGA